MDSEDYVCCNCIGDRYLKREIEDADLVKKCSYCDGDEAEVIEFDELAQRIEEIYREFFIPGNEVSRFFGDSDRLEYSQEGDDPQCIIDEMLQSDDHTLVDDILSKLSGDEEYAVIKDCETAMFDSCSCYTRVYTGKREHQNKWEEFTKVIKHSSRFFSSEAKSLLDDIFRDIGKFNSNKGHKPIRTIDGDEIFRARRFTTDEEIIKINESPEKELAAPPSHMAPNGRLSPLGIPVLYGAFDYETCLAELRLAVGDRAICGKFEVFKPLRILDVSLLRDAFIELSFFDPEFETKCSQMEFLNDFEIIISKPYSPEEIDLEYLPMQVMTEYLTRYVEGGIDAIVFSSAQKGMRTKNIAILKPRVEGDNRLPDDHFYFDGEACEPNLRFVTGSLSIHQITAVEYKHSNDDLNAYLRFKEYEDRDNVPYYG
ncbi:RES domain-containing protein [Shewanella frigidimarina]|uniref:RES domain-containing protein n=1 Tax=Shewanella frigidimarina TaxID=56812 RepID=UPI001404491A|nr:RES domain-containing protein [Shewanella frigidimarina]